MPLILFIVMMLLATGFVGVRVAEALRIPHSVFLVLLGLAAGYGLRAWHPELQAPFVEHFPEIVVLIFLPPLIFESAFHLELKALRKDAVPIAALSIVGLGFSTLLIGYGLYRFFGLELLPSLTFGALISATDPVAVVALFREVGAPERLSTLIEGESLTNDGTAMVLFRALMAATLTGEGVGGLAPGILWKFALVIAGSLAVGLVLAAATGLVLRFASRSAAAQLGITLVSAYLSFLIADAYLHLSGVITTMVVGLYLGNRARQMLNEQAFAVVNQIWELIALSANTLVFFAVGIAVNPQWVLRKVAFIPFALLIVYLARTISVFSTVPLVNRLKLAAPITRSFQTVLMWGGLRGGLALGLVLTLPRGFPHHELFLALAVSVVFATLVINALTTGPVLSLLGLKDAQRRKSRNIAA